MCEACGRDSVGPITFAKVLSKQQLGPEEQAALEQFMRRWNDVLSGPQRTLVEAVEAGDVPLSQLETIRAEVRPAFGNFTNDFETVYVAGTENGAQAGRAVAARQFGLDVAFDIVPERTLTELTAWAEEATEASMETMTDDVAHWLRSAHEQGLSIDDIAAGLNEDVFDDRLKDWQAERTARTATISSSNAGAHSAYEDASGVVGEEWLATNDDRTRDTHLAAGGQIAPVDGTFLVGGATARYPGDPQLPLKELVNCRCAVVPVFRQDLSDAEFATIDAGGRVNAPA